MHDLPAHEAVLILETDHEAGLTDGPQTLGSNSLPFEIDRFRLQGTAEPSGTPGQLTVTGEPHNMVRAHPLLKSVTAYGNGR